MDKEIKRYYKQRQHGGRGSAAQVADGVVLRVIFALACYLWFHNNVSNQIMAIMLTTVTTVLFLFALRLWRGLSLEKFVAKEKERLRETVLRERLLLLAETEFIGLCKSIVDERPQAGQTLLWCSQRAATLDEDAILNAFHAAQSREKDELVICTLSPLTARATLLLKRLPLHANCINADQITRAAAKMEAFAVSEEDVEEYIKNEQSLRQARRERMQAQPFSSGRARKYLVCAAVLFAASFITGYTLYYRLMAGLCATLAATSVFINRPSPEAKKEQQT